MPLHLLSESKLQLFSESLETAFSQWRSQWYLPNRQPMLSVSVPSPTEWKVPEGFYWYRHGHGMETVYVGARANDFANWANCLLGGDAGEEDGNESEATTWFLRRIVIESLADLIARLVRHRFSDGQSIRDAAAVEAIYRPFSGMICLCFNWESAAATHTLIVTLSAELTAQWSARLTDGKRPGTQGATKPSLISRAQAVEPLAVELCVELDGDALSVSDIQGLQRGDVIMLKRSIRDPISVKTHGGQLVGHCYLGQVQGHRGVRLIKKTGAKQYG